MTVSQGIFKWMEENKDFFKPQGVCKKVGIDKGNFSRYKKDGAIPEKYLQPIMALIMPLGFTLDEVIAENNKPENKNRILAEREGEFKMHDLGDGVTVKEKALPEELQKSFKSTKKPFEGAVGGLLVPKQMIPPMPVKEKGEDSIDFAARKSEWKKKYNI